ncbi:CDP-diacylglycerol diphosphatase [Candidatus Sodalis sp. SoCistrobi]|uniref:CDP-diacylglycerol diphosphatase n=1 Tax=Candidatus Sodalis sp. SoCistrobi TaxID=1922216 RepID=UPI00093B6CC2|nr:CDP-diacylglycerol diphosphatase [Candidatus Sodalis sp. SoCistrobi]
MTWQQIKYALLLVIVILVAALGAWQYYHTSSPTHPDALWEIVSEKCVPNQLQRGDPAPCSEVNTAAGYVVYKDDFVGPLQFLLMPTDKISGIESPRLLSTSTPNFFYLAWQARHFLSERRGKPIGDRFLSLAINSAYGRTQNQLHIHISCLRPDIRERLDNDAANISTDWQPLAQPILGHRYLARRISTAGLAAQSPFLLLAREVPDASEEMGEYGMALAPLPDGSLVLLASQRSLLNRNIGSVEEIQDHSCAILNGH